MFGFGKKTQASVSNGKKDQPIPAPSSSLKNSLLSLEQRLMFDAAAAATASEVATEQVAQEQAEAAVSHDAAGSDAQTADQAESQSVLDAIATYNPGESRSEVVFVDPTVPNYQDLLSGMNSNIEVIMLDGGQDGIEQMANALSGRSSIDAIHVISHGSAGELQLGTGVLNADSMSTQYADDLAVIQQSLSEQADILVYGCDFAQGEAGQAAVDMLAQLTGADVQASNDLTGSILLGGDWEFEVSTGTIETSLAVDYDVQMNWAGVLGTETVADSFSSKSFGNNDGTQSWSSNWSEVDVGASDAKGGHIKVNSGQLRIETQEVGASVSRGVDLSAASSATLSFDYTNDIDKGGSVEIRISTDGGASYQTLSGGTFSNSDHTGSGRVSFDISSYASANTKIQFAVTGSSGGDRLFVDNIQVNYVTGAVDPGPTDITLTGNTVAENAATGTVVGTAAGADIDTGDTKTYSLTNDAGGRFAIDASTGQITVADGSLLNYEAQADHSITVMVTDSDGQSIDRTFLVHLTNIDETPIDITLTGNTVVENAATGTVVGTAVGIDPDAGDTKTYSLTDSAEGRFAINETTGEITVADGSLLNYETQASHSVTIQVTDAGGLTVEKTFTINLTNVTEAPTALTLTGHMVVEHASTGTVVGTVSGMDPDAGDTKTYSLTDTGGGRFAIDSTTGQLTVADGSLLNYESASSHSVTVRVTDSGGQSYDETFTINLTNVDEGPTDITLTGNTVVENAATGTVVGTAVGIDPDAGDTKTYSLTDTAGGRFAINETTGEITVADGSLLNYETQASHSVTIQVTDAGGLTVEKTFTINLTNVTEEQSAQVASSNLDGNLMGSLFGNNEGRPSRTGNSESSVGASGVGETDSESMLPNDSRHTIEWGTKSVATAEPELVGRNVAQYTQEEVVIHGKGENHTSALAGVTGIGENLDSGKSTSDRDREAGLWPQAEEIDTVQEGSAGLGMSMAVGLAGMVWQGNKGTKEKMTTMKSQVQALHQEPLPDRASQHTNAEDEKSSSDESQP